MWLSAFKPFDVADAVAKQPQPPLGADPRVEQADAAGRARCGVLAYGGSPRSLLLLVEPHQVGVGHVDFAADFQHRRKVACRAAAAARRANVRMLCVTSSPTRPLPRVTPRTSSPSS